MKYMALTRLWEKAQWRDENGLLQTEWWDEGAIMDYPADFPPDYPQEKIDILLDLGRIAPHTEAGDRINGSSDSPTA